MDKNLHAKADGHRPPLHPSASKTPRGRRLTDPQPRPVTVIASLNDAYCYEPDGGDVRISREGEIVPTKSRRKTFGRGLQRLRDRLRHLDERLQLDISSLKQETLNLQLHKSLMENKLLAQRTREADAAVQCVAEFFSAFANGWLEIPQNAESGNDFLFETERQRLLIDRQRYFVTTALHPAMQYGDFSNGPHVLASHWKMYSKYFDRPGLSLASLSCDSSSGSPLVVAKGVSSGIFTAHTLRVLFPHLEPAGLLAQQLLGCTLHSPCTIMCYFHSTMKIIRFNVDIDHVAGLNVLLGDPTLVVEVLAGSYLANSHA